MVAVTRGQAYVEWFQPDYQIDASGPGHDAPESTVFLLPLAVIEHRLWTFFHRLVVVGKPIPGKMPRYVSESGFTSEVEGNREA